MPSRTEDFYEDFSRDAGLRDWALPNSRHEHLRTVIDKLLHDRSGLRILDVGCGAGVMSGHLTRYGRVDGVDLSRGAVSLANLLVPGGSFRAGRLDELGLPGPYDVIAMFDVLEHIPREERSALLADLTARLAPDGILFASTPQGAFTRWLLDSRPDLAQVLEVEVHLHELLPELRALGFELAHYEVYELEYARQYQAMAFVYSPREPGGAPRHPAGLRSRRLVRGNPAARVLRRLRPAARLTRRAGARAGLRFVAGRVPTIVPEHYGEPADRRDGAATPDAPVR
jgi:SAM-dependent methyltransferase